MGATSADAQHRFHDLSPHPWPHLRQRLPTADDARPDVGEVDPGEADDRPDPLLSDLGVGIEVERVYRLLLRLGRATSDQLLLTTSLPSSTVDDALTQLHALGFVQWEGREHIAAVDPGVCVERLIEEQLASLRSVVRRVEAVRTSVHALRQEASTHAQQSAPDFERIVGGAAVWARLDELSFFARQEVLTIHPSAPWEPEYIEAARPLDLRCVRRGVRVRTIVVRQALEDPVTRAYLAQLVSAGAQVRWTKESVRCMIIYDRGHAVVPLNPQDSWRGVAVASQHGLLAGLVDLFERIWQEARPMGGAEASPLSAIDRQVLELLARVDKDEAAARELGVSLRTFQRYLANVMARLDTTSRFQAALSAKERGWL